MAIVIFYSVVLLCGNFLVTSNDVLKAEKFTCEVIKLIVGYHNQLRKNIANGKVRGQPQGKNLLRLIWDESLHKKAQNWAENMVMMHNPDKTEALGRFNTGENLFYEYSTVPNQKFNWKKAMDGWFDEYKDYTYHKLRENEGSPVTGHYTQFVWHDTMYIGCGATYYVKPKGIYNKLYVCNYGPGGNYVGRFPYEVGSGCTNLCCTADHTKTYGSKC